MNGRFLLDTNILIALFANDNSVRTHLAKAPEVFIPTIAIGELFYGAWKSQRTQENLKRIEDLILETPILGCGVETARLYGRVKSTLRIKGHPIPENDIWIAAIALEHNLTLVTRDAHFAEIPDLSTTAW
ncbi:MAG TPA: type II toxin-antitoxin system VapC family toxin [Thermoflexia bacterium]|jgi:tRNA(fMet)-specific endonuclease VapC|nr:type II toxin-antitoxin system VapC family toxin [Thermoflexia bacterium]